MALTNLTTPLVLDVYDHDLTPSTIKSIACDSNTRYVTAVIKYQNTYYDIGSDATVILTVLRPDGSGVSVTGSAYSYTYENGMGDTQSAYGAQAELSDAAIELKGKLVAQFKMVVGDQVLRTEIFYINNGRALDVEIEEWVSPYQTYNLDDIISIMNHISEQGMLADVQVVNTSVLNNGIANIPAAGVEQYGVVRISDSPDACGVGITNGRPHIINSGMDLIKAGLNLYCPITPHYQEYAVFYGLAKAAGDTSQAATAGYSLAYTEEAKSKIHALLGINAIHEETVTGSVLSLDGEANVRYMCEDAIENLVFMPCVSGECEIIFFTGDEEPVVTITGSTIFPVGFTSFEANKSYRVKILNGIYVTIDVWPN